MTDDLPIRCTCSAAPILAIARVGLDGQRFVHLKIFKQKRVYGEIVVQRGLVRIKCRACARWYTVNVRDGDHSVRSEDLPESIKLPS